MFIAHHRVNNILHNITEPKHWHALQQSREIHDQSSFGWLERACFSLVAFVMQCNANTIESIFGDTWTAEGSPDFVADLFSRLRLGAMALFPRTSSARALTDIVGTSMRYSAGFLIQTKIRLRLHFDAARRPLSLLPPSLPPIDPASPYDEPWELGSAAFTRPWLRDGLAGTPLAGLSSTAGQRWAGYYTYTSTAETMRDPPMFFKLYFAPPPAADPAALNVYFRGGGTDGIGLYTLGGACDMQTGEVTVRKAYVGDHWWDWHGVMTPFGMVGVWGIDSRNFGWWWIWPQEWSESSPAPAAAVASKATG